MMNLFESILLMIKGNLKKVVHLRKFLTFIGID